MELLGDDELRAEADSLRERAKGASRSTTCSPRPSR